MAFDFRAYAVWCGSLYLLSLGLFILHSTLSRLVTQSSRTLSKVVVALDAGKYILLWYAISISMTMYNKWYLTVWRGGFSFPVSVSCIHMFAKLALSRLSIGIMGGKVAPLPWRTYLKQAVPIGASTGIDIMLSNVSFLYVSVHFYTIAKSGSVVWVLMFSLCLGLIKPELPLLAVVFFIFGGISTASMGELHFQWVGLFLVLAAGMMGGFRWALTQLFLRTLDTQHKELQEYGRQKLPQLAPGASSLSSAGSQKVKGTGRLSTLDLVYHISPASAAVLVPFAIWKEGGSFSTSPFFAPLFGNSIANVTQTATRRLVGSTVTNATAAVTAAATALTAANSTSNIMSNSTSTDSMSMSVSVADAGEGDTTFDFASVSPWDTALSAFGLAMLGGVVAFALIVVEVKVVSKTSALSLSVAGNMKDVTQICLSVAIFHEQITPLNIVGLCCAVVGISIYAHSKVRHAAHQQRMRSPRSERRRQSNRSNGRGGGSGSSGGGGGGEGGRKARIKGQYSATSMSDIEVTAMLRQSSIDDEETDAQGVMMNQMSRGDGFDNNSALGGVQEDGKSTCLLQGGSGSDGEGEEANGDDEFDLDMLELQEADDPVACL